MDGMLWISEKWVVEILGIDPKVPTNLEKWDFQKWFRSEDGGYWVYLRCRNIPSHDFRDLSNEGLFGKGGGREVRYPSGHGRTDRSDSPIGQPTS